MTPNMGGGKFLDGVINLLCYESLEGRFGKSYFPLTSVTRVRLPLGPPFFNDLVNPTYIDGLWSYVLDT